MPYPPKSSNLSVLLAKAETTYGTPVAVTGGADAQLLALSDRHEGLVKRDALYKGDSGPAPGNTGMLPRFKQAGFFDVMSMPFRFKGKGAAYSASIKPAGFVLFQAAGFDLAFSGGAGAEKWTGTPTPDATIPTALTTEYYHFGEKYAGTGALCSLNWEFGNGAPPLFGFDFQWIANGQVVDGAAPAATYPDLTVIEPIAYRATVEIGTFLTGVVRSGGFKANRKLVARPNLNGSSEHMGFYSTSWEPEVTVVVEKTALVASPFHTAAGLDARRLMQDAGQFAMTVGWNQTVQYNRFKQVMAQVQLAGDVQDTHEDGVPTWTIRAVPIPSTPGATFDWMSLVWD